MKHITISMDENCKFINGHSNENETISQIEFIFNKLMEHDYIKTDYNKPTEVELYNTGGKYENDPVYEITFSHDGEPDYDYVPFITMTEEKRTQLGL